MFSVLRHEPGAVTSLYVIHGVGSATFFIICHGMGSVTFFLYYKKRKKNGR